MAVRIIAIVIAEYEVYCRCESCDILLFAPDPSIVILPVIIKYSVFYMPVIRILLMQTKDIYKNYSFIILILMAGKSVLLFIVAFIFIALGILCLKTAMQKVSFMEKWRQKGTEPSRNYSRLYFLFLAAVLIYCGVLVLKTLLHNWKGLNALEIVFGN